MTDNDKTAVLKVKRYREYRYMALVGALTILLLLASEPDKGSFEWLMIVVWTLALLRLASAAYLDRSDRKIAEESAAYRERLLRGLDDHRRRREDT